MTLEHLVSETRDERRIFLVEPTDSIKQDGLQTLASQILRADPEPIASLAVLQFIWGDLWRRVSLYWRHVLDRALDAV